MMLGERPNFGVVNTIINSNKAFRDIKALNLNTTQVFSLRISSDDIGINLPILNIPEGKTYTFISASYNNVDDDTRLSVTFPVGLASAEINSPFGFISFAGPVTEGQVLVNASMITGGNNIGVNLCFLTS